MKFKKKYKVPVFSLLVFSLLIFIAPGVNLWAEPVSAVEPLRQSAEQDKVLFDKALLLSTQKEWVQAEKIYRGLIKRQPLWPEAKNNLAVVLLKTERLDEARQFLESAVISSPSYRIAQQNRSKLYNYLASQAYNQVLEVKAPLKLPELELILQFKPVNSAVVEEKISERQTEPEPEVGRNFFAEDTTDINEQLASWSRAWSEGDIEQYIQAYSTRFIASDRKTFSAWKNARKARFKQTRGVDVSIEQVRVFFESTAEPVQGEQYVLVEFLQHYQSASYQDKVLKQMYMRKQQNSWLILSERTIKTF